MTAQPWPDHLLTVEEFAALPEDNSRRYELQEGLLIVSPRATSLHQQVALHLQMSLYGQLPDGWRVAADMELVVTEPGFMAGVRVPDVVIAPADVVKANLSRFTADQILVAVEIISPGSRRTDTVVKPVEYANAGIPYYWVIDMDPPLSLAAYHLAGDFGYQEAPAVTGTFRTMEPFPLEVDLTTLLDGPGR